MRIWIQFSALAFAVFVAATPGASRSLTRGGVVCTTAPIALCTLPRVPWEGGPAYWARFAPMVAAGWTNPSFFPFALWNGVLTTTQSQIDKYLSVGANTLIPAYSGDDVTLIRSNGIFAVPTLAFAGALPTGMGVETVGWLLGDEPELNYGSGAGGFTGAASPRDNSQCIPPGGSCGQGVLSYYKAHLPADGHPYYANFSHQIMTMPLARAHIFVNNFTNFLSHDIYWYSDGSICSGDKGGIILGTGTDLTSDQCHRSSNYGVALAKFRALASPLQPIFGFTEATTSGGNTLHLRGAVWNNIINEARGIILFNYDSGGCGGDAILINCVGINPGVTAVSGEIRAVAPVLNTQSFQWTFNANINSMLKFGPDGKWYIFAMQAGFNDAGTYTFALPTGFTTAPRQC
jgi:hypothetical protein